MRTRAEKEAMVSSLREKLQAANSILIVDYRGLTVSDANDLRGRLRAAGDGKFEYCVAKNSLVRLAAQGPLGETMGPYLTGPTALALSYDEPAALAKVLVGYAKENEKFEIKGGVIEGEVVDLATVRRLAELPTRDELRAKFLATLQAPMRQLAGTLQSLLGYLRNALEARQKQLENS